MLPGFNTNIRHRGVLFHVQSEDSGRDHPHIITHLYYGGTIAFSEKSSYAARVDEPDLPGVVRGLMEGQHKAVLKRLRAGDFDEVIRERLGGVFEGEGEGESEGLAKQKPSETAPLEAATPNPADTSTVANQRPTPPAVAAPRSFGEGIVSERPLDDVILGYLIDNARKRRAKS